MYSVQFEGAKKWSQIDKITYWSIIGDDQPMSSYYHIRVGDTDENVYEVLGSAR
jgi:hypothetical protein